MLCVNDALMFKPIDYEEDKKVINIRFAVVDKVFDS